MKLKNVLKVLPLTSLIFAGVSQADEGMWQPHQLQQISGKLKQAGL